MISFIIAAFIWELATGYVTRDEGKVLMDFPEAEGQLLNLTVFFLLGIIIAGLIHYITWHIVLYAVLSLTVYQNVTCRHISYKNQNMSGFRVIHELVRSKRACVTSIGFNSVIKGKCVPRTKHIHPGSFYYSIV